MGPTATLTTETTYCYNDPKCDPYVLPSSSITTLSNGLKTQQQFVFDLPYLGSTKPTKVQEWDYYTGSPSQTPTKETDYSYVGLGFDLHQITVKNNGTQTAQTTYAYTTSALNNLWSCTARNCRMRKGLTFSRSRDGVIPMVPSWRLTYAGDDTGMDHKRYRSEAQPFYYNLLSMQEFSALSGF